MNKQVMAERLEHAMSLRKVSQTDLWKLTGISRSSLSEYLQGKFEPRSGTLVKIAKALDVSESWLMGYDVPMRRGEPYYNSKRQELTIPFLNQKASAGFWKEELPEECIIAKTINILPIIAGGQATKSLIALEVSGDSMVDENLCDGDIVVFSRGRISGDGLYVLVIGTTVAVKRVEFDPINNKIRVCSANRQKGYEPVVLANEEGTYRILGKVTGWIHGNHN